MTKVNTAMADTANGSQGYFRIKSSLNAGNKVIHIKSILNV